MIFTIVSLAVVVVWFQLDSRTVPGLISLRVPGSILILTMMVLNWFFPENIFNNGARAFVVTFVLVMFATAAYAFAFMGCQFHRRSNFYFTLVYLGLAALACALSFWSTNLSGLVGAVLACICLPVFYWISDKQLRSQVPSKNIT